MKDYFLEPGVTVVHIEKIRSWYEPQRGCR
jgi:hypothetical protein